MRSFLCQILMLSLGHLAMLITTRELRCPQQQYGVNSCGIAYARDYEEILLQLIANVV